MFARVRGLSKRLRACSGQSRGSLVCAPASAAPHRSPRSGQGFGGVMRSDSCGATLRQSRRQGRPAAMVCAAPDSSSV